MAESAWLITLNHPGMSGFLAVKQTEDPSGVYGVVTRVSAEPDRDWPDRPQWFLSTADAPTVPLATGDLARYQGGRFEEYNFVNAADLKNHGRILGKVRFVIYPAE